MSTKAESVKTTEPIITAIKDEHKYTEMLLSVLKEQLAEYDIGKKPDHNLMLEVSEYMGNFPKKFNHKRKNNLIKAVIAKDTSLIELEDLLAERRELAELNKEIAQSLKFLIKDHSILQQEQLKIFSKNFIELLESHIAIERNMVLPKAEKTLNSDDFQQLNKGAAQHDSEFSANLEERYQGLADDINKRFEDFEDVANEFALAEFVSLSAFFESIEPLALGVHEVSQIIKDYSYKMFSSNLECYKDVVTNSQDSRSDYLEKPIDCALECYENYVDGMSKIAEVLRKTKKEIYEPYQARKAFFETNDDQGAS